MSAGVPARPSARDRLLAAADELFYEHGVHTVGIDTIIERAAVAKASLYSTFGSKDELVRAYLEGRHRSRRERLLARVEAVAGASGRPGRDRVEQPHRLGTLPRLDQGARLALA